MTKKANKLEKYLKLIFVGLEPKNKARWRTAVANAVTSMPESELRHIPAIKIHRTLMGAMSGTFNSNSEQIDGLAKHYFNSDIWAFAHLSDKADSAFTGKKGVRKIVFASIPGLGKSLNIPPEMSIFHEFGHFYMQLGKGIELNSENEMQVEYDCDRFSVMAFIRMLYKNPCYTPIVVTENTVSFVDSLRLKAEQCRKGGMKGLALNREYYAMADKFMEKMQWKKLYEKTYVQGPSYNS